MAYQSEYEKYRGKRALMLLRVSTKEQEKGFGWAAQEMEIRKHLIDPLELVLNEDTHMLRDTYTGLEFKERPVLDRILELAQERTFEVLVTDVLDRLGRQGLPRELYRMQLRELGVRILTTDPEDHSDDDSFSGEVIRYLRGKEAEQEVYKIRRRTMSGRRAKAEGRLSDGTIGEKKIVGNGQRIYGYKYIFDEKGKKIGITPNHVVILIEPNGTKWTEVTVVIFIFESAANGITQREIARILNEKGIPSPYAVKGMKKRGMVGQPVWLASTISKHILRQSAYWGEYRQFRTESLFREKRPGKKGTPRRKTSEAEQVIIAVPPLVTRELAETALARTKRNKSTASRNNPEPEKTLLRAGLVKCGECGGNLHAHHRYRQHADGNIVGNHFYECNRAQDYKCKGCSVAASLLDPDAWVEAVKVIRDPALFEKQIQDLFTDNPLLKQRESTMKHLADIRTRQKNLRNNLNTMMQEGGLDKNTRDYLAGQLQTLATEEEEALKELASEGAFQEKLNKLQHRIAEFRRKCTQWREKLADPQFTPDYDFQRDAVEFLGITAIVYRDGHNPRYEIKPYPPSIVSLLS